MKIVKISEVHNQMLVEISKKWKKSSQLVIETLIAETYSSKRSR